MRVALYKHLQSLSPRFWARSKLGDVVSRINSDISEVQRVASDSCWRAINVVFLIGSAVIMASLNFRLFLLGIAVIPFSLWALRHYRTSLRAGEGRPRKPRISVVFAGDVIGDSRSGNGRRRVREVARLTA
jgi:ATP-binding cassette subfamily B protein